MIRMYRILVVCLLALNALVIGQVGQQVAMTRMTLASDGFSEGLALLRELRDGIDVDIRPHVQPPTGLQHLNALIPAEIRVPVRLDVASPVLPAFEIPSVRVPVVLDLTFPWSAFATRGMS